MKKYINQIGILILLVLFILFFIIASYFLDKRNISKIEPINDNNNVVENNNDVEREIVNSLYQNVRILYDVVNNKFRVSQDDTIIIGDVVYKKILNFNEVMNQLFTRNGINKYLEDLSSYFAYSNGEYYLAGNLVSYQTYYFRGDDTNIFVVDMNENEIKAIIYEKWTSSNKNTLATIKVVNENNQWLIDNINILATE